MICKTAERQPFSKQKYNLLQNPKVQRFTVRGASGATGHFRPENCHVLRLSTEYLLIVVFSNFTQWAYRMI